MAKRKGGGQPGNKNALKWSDSDLIQIGEELLKWMNQDQNIWFEKFLMSKGLYRDFVSDRAENCKSFAELIKKAKQMQEARIAEFALHNKINTTMSIFLLKNNHGYRDRQEHSHSAQGGLNVIVSDDSVKKKINKLN